jgi:colanic acid/amylovoran biosynthesis glycosyltransferase
VSKPPALVLLTAFFPFGKTSETFLESEIETLAERFERVFVLPSHRAVGVRTMPANVELVEMDWLEEPTREAKLRSLASPVAARVLGVTIAARPGLSAYFGARRRLYVDNLARNILKARSLLRFVKERGLEDALFYDYWLENTALALALLRRSRQIGPAIARAHNFDIYDECWGDNPVPFQDYKGRGLDAVFAISADGRSYLERVPSLRGKVRVQRLGVREPVSLPEENQNGEPLVVSCARLVDVKRVDMIPTVLAGLKRPVRWIHFGDGPERERVEAEAARLPGDVKWELRGQVENRAVLDFYARNHVDALLSLSTSEGVPVSMMEAQSYGVPVVACGIHGVPEIVDDETGVVLPASVSVAQATEAVANALAPGRFDRNRIRASFARNFTATTNYNAFSNEIIRLWEAQVKAA